MSKFNSKNITEKDLTGIIKITGNIGFVGNKMILSENFLEAKDGDNVKLEKLDNNPSSALYKVVEIINSGNLVDDLLKNINSKTNEILKEGVYRAINEKGGFIKVIGIDSDVYVSKNNSLGAKDGDRVSCIITKIGHKNEALVKEILEKSKSYEYGVYNGGKILLNGEKEIKITNISDFSLEDGDIFSLELGEGKTGTINAKLHPKWKNSLDELKIVLNAGVDIEFSQEVIDEVEAISEIIEEAEILRRVDLRDLYTITIDGPDTKDIDDGISIEDLGDGNIKVYVHIADVSHYIKEGSFTDIEAQKRATSIYFVDKVIPMIPEKLSNGLCSLNPFEDKLAMTCEYIVDKNGKINFTKSKVYKSVINSNARTTYKEVQDIFEGKGGDIGSDLQFGGSIDENLISTIKNSFAVTRAMNSLRLKEGELIFENSEVKIKLDKDRNPVKFEKYTTYESNDLIKALMVGANEVVDTLYGDGPFLHRTHGKPKQEKIDLLKEIFAYMEVDLEGIEIKSENINALLKLVENHPKKDVIQTQILRTLQLAKYTHTLEGHHGLALQRYAHFTSPIRRYPDTQIHRIISETLSGDLDIGHYNSILEKVAMNCSLMEQRAEKIEAKINTMYAIKYLENKIGKEFDATVMSINERGISINVVIGDDRINANVFIDSEKGYSYKSICKGLGEMEKYGETILKIGDTNKFRLISLNKDDLAINFELV